MTRIPLIQWAASLRPPLDPRYARRLCVAGRVVGARQEPWSTGHRWVVPEDTPDPRRPAGRPRRHKVQTS